MNLWHAALLGLVQGLCEFLPVSSSGHLVLLQNIFGIQEGALFFDSMLHAGTLVAVFVVFRRQIWELICHPIQKKMGLLLAATAVTAVMAFLFKDLIDSAYSGGLLGFGFLITAVVLMINERLARGKKKIPEMGVQSALAVGFMQGIAILPGISRSGTTIAGSRLFGLAKEDAAEFSFLLSIPAILGSLILQLPDAIAAGPADVPWSGIVLGMALAAVSGYFAIRLMLKLIKEKSLKGFAVYVGILGILVLLDQLVLHIFF